MFKFEWKIEFCVVAKSNFILAFLIVFKFLCRVHFFRINLLKQNGMHVFRIFLKNSFTMPSYHIACLGMYYSYIKIITFLKSASRFIHYHISSPDSVSPYDCGFALSFCQPVFVSRTTFTQCFLIKLREYNPKNISGWFKIYRFGLKRLRY